MPEREPKYFYLKNGPHSVDRAGAALRKQGIRCVLAYDQNAVLVARADADKARTIIQNVASIEATGG